MAITSLKQQNFPVFSRETGNSETETGSPMTASTAKKKGRRPKPTPAVIPKRFA